jgi:alkylated DNA repair dioxygenase AlkB
MPRSQPDLFAARLDSSPGNFPDGFPEGLAYQENVFSAGEERQFLAAVLALPLKPFEFHGHLANRRVLSYGLRYDYGGRRLERSAAVPDFLLPLRERAGAIANLPAKAFAHVLVSEYAPGAGIGWHRDKGVFADVVGFSFGASCLLRFRRKEEARWRRFSMTVKPRSAYLLRRAARHDWEHSIPPVDLLRYSVTFRSLGSQEDG